MVAILILFAIFFSWLVYVVWKTKELVADDPSIISKMLVVLNYGVCIIICIYCTLQVEPNAVIELTELNANPIGSVIVYCFMWCIFSALGGAILAVISRNIAILYSVIIKDPSAFKRGYTPPGFESASWSGLYAGSIATAYSLILYILGLSGKIFPIMFFI